MDPHPLLAALPGDAFGFVLVLARVGAACMLVPVIGEAEVPTTIRAGFCIALSAMLLPVLLPALPLLPAAPPRLAGLVIAELLAGLLIGWLARLVVLALAFAGQLAALSTGLASVIQPDPALGAQSSALGRLMSVAAPVILLASGLYRLPLAALAGSYDVIAPGQVLPAADTMELALRAVAGLMTMAARLAAPFALASLLGHLALALVSRLVPNLQVFGLAAPLQLLAGLVLLALLTGGVLAAWQSGAGAAFAALPGR